MEKLKADSQLVANPSAKGGLEDMALLFNYLDALKATRNVSSRAPISHLTPGLLRSLLSKRSRLLHRHDLRSNHLRLSTSTTSKHRDHNPYCLQEKETRQP